MNEDVDPQILALVQRLAGSTMGPPPAQDTPPPPIAQQPYVQAEQLTAEAAPPPDPTEGMSPMKAALYKGIQGFGQGLAYSHTPGGYAGHVQLEHQNERQRQQDLLGRAKELRGEGLQQSQLYGQEQERGLARERQQSVDELNRRNVESQIYTREHPDLTDKSTTDTELFMKDPDAYERMLRVRALVNPPASSQRNIDPNSPEGIAARLEFEKQRPRPPLAPIVINTAEGPQVVNRATKTAAPIKGQEGEAVGLVPTAEQRNRVAALQKVEPILNSISELSEKINVGKGIEAKVQGEVEKAKARANYNDDVAEYEALISGFTPMVARAVGHVGVLTEQDVQSVRKLFPAPGDSKTLRDRKLARIRTVMEGMNAASTGGAAPAAGGLPQVGDTFNGAKVLKVTPIQ